MKNDVAFLISGTMNLYEHQSTFNPNMPVRGLMYFSKLYEKYIVTNGIDIYTSTPKKLPFPQYFVFYNGTMDEPDRSELKLTDLLDMPASPKTSCLECVAIMLNINYGHNKVLMEKCRRLKEYAIFVDAVRKGLSAGAPLEQSLSHAVDSCIDNDILKDILIKQKVEVIQMILETYDKELHDKTLRREGYEDGYNEGLAAAKETGIRQFISTLQELQLSHENVLKKLHEKYELSQEESEIYMKKYWEK
ncbi:hypothetical protein [Mediterraneibacter glycyrrhizinilyticus]|uniref:hypothetical protein n=1 Tax=Mediterraneibacter glycyrrhizinilyticus TaxID=342942 RepID=UPI0025A40AAC|nr:hypothetical protein [Mediterraneibacter glycyrrhizinilyticus]MDM8126365.1 hypothetical protein [Mediterraneibacter glycyrrhizinilyticus]